MDRCPEDTICPYSYIPCSDLHCATSNTLCPRAVACPPSTVLCGNLQRCGLSEEECSFVHKASCPPHAPILCADRVTCVISTSLCPSTPECPAGQVRCENGVCRQSAKECPMPTPCPADRPVRCADGTCSAEDPITCSTSAVCPRDFVLTTDGRCISLAGHGQALISSAGSCPSYMVTCPDKTCAMSLHLCPSVPLCPTGLIRCHDGSCRPSIALCPGHVAYCPPPRVLCPNKQCVLHAEDCIPGVICPSSRPVLCPQGTCAVSMRHCLQSTLSEVLFYEWEQTQTADGQSASHTMTSTTANVPIAVTTMLQLMERTERTERTPSHSRKTKVSLGPSFSVQEYGNITVSSINFTIISREQAARRHEGELVDLSILLDQPVCPHAFPFLCPFSSRCVASLADCPSLLPCPTALPYRCFDGRCAASSSQCPDPASYDERTRCPLGYVLCPLTDLCKRSLSLCPTRHVCKPEEVLCVDGSCKGFFGVPSTLPTYLTAETVVGRLLETFLVGEEYDQSLRSVQQNAVTTCLIEKTTAEGYDRSCCTGNTCDGNDYMQCIQAKIEISRQECELSLRRYPCKDCSDAQLDEMECPPSFKRCADGRCISQTSTCSDIPLCPRTRPVRCANGQCVVTASLCEGLTSCPEGQVLCEDGSCALGYQACSSIQCPAERPVLCWDQSCRKAVKDCPEKEVCPEDRVFCGVTGECVYDRSTCVSSR